ALGPRVRIGTLKSCARSVRPLVWSPLRNLGLLLAKVSRLRRTRDRRGLSCTHSIPNGLFGLGSNAIMLPQDNEVVSSYPDAMMAATRAPAAIPSWRRRAAWQLRHDLVCGCVRAPDPSRCPARVALRLGRRPRDP